jgi:nicotinate phosphoribosyltransferase
MEDQALALCPEDYSLLTDLYQLTMAACYVGEGLDQRQASFELFVRHLPQNYGYLIAMGLTQALDYLENFRFTAAQIEALKATQIFAAVSPQFWDLLAEARFTGDVWAVPEGTAIFANEPLLRVEAPLWQAQIVETYLLNALNYQTLVATRAARLRDVAGAQAQLLEFGTRRAFSPQGAVWAARAALAAGLDSTSNVLAALKLGRKPSGTMAHSLVMAFSALAGEEDEAYEAFHRHFPKATLLIDTYDTLATARRLAERSHSGNMTVTGVRLDSGDLASLSKSVRSLLPNVNIFASGDIDEHKIAELQRDGAEIDGYGLGTKLVTGTPVNGVYKLVEIDGIATMKESSSKTTYPGRKQIFRHVDENGFQFDRLALVDEASEAGEPQLQLMMQQGKRLHNPESLEAIAARTAASVAQLPASVRQIEAPLLVEPKISAALQELTERTHRQIHKSYTQESGMRN